MAAWLEALLAGEQLVWSKEPLEGVGRLLALAPHPDDAESVGITLRLLQQGGWDIYFAEVTPGWSGVEDSFAGPSKEAKNAAREAEQRASAQVFGVPDDHLFILHMPENARGDLVNDEPTKARLFAFLDEMSPELVVLPWKDDTNPTHRLNYEYLEEWAQQANHRVLVLANKDPKTISFRADLRVVFDEEEANFKRTLLECHKSQTARNLNTRGYTISDRVLMGNRPEAEDEPAGSYVERFRFECFQPSLTPSATR